MYVFEMDPFGDLFSFINRNDLKEEKEVKNLDSDTDENIRAQRLDLSKNEQICKLCEKGEAWRMHNYSEIKHKRPQKF